MQNSTIQDISSFVIKPYEIRNKELSIQQRLIKTFKLLIFSMLLTAASRLLISLLESITGVGGIPQTDLANTQTTLSKSSNFNLLLYIAFIALYEELFFRLALTTYNRKIIQASVSIILGTLIMWNIEVQNIYVFSLFYQNLVFYGLLLAIFSSLIFIILRKLWFYDFPVIWAKYFPVIFYISTIIFAVYHMPFGKLSVMQYIISPITLLPYFIMGFSLGYVRIKHGIAYSFIFHLTYNLIGSSKFFLN